MDILIRLVNLIIFEICVIIKTVGMAVGSWFNIICCYTERAVFYLLGEEYPVKAYLKDSPSDKNRPGAVANAVRPLTQAVSDKKTVRARAFKIKGNNFDYEEEFKNHAGKMAALDCGQTPAGGIYNPYLNKNYESASRPFMPVAAVEIAGDKDEPGKRVAAIEVEGPARSFAASPDGLHLAVLSKTDGAGAILEIFEGASKNRVRRIILDKASARAPIGCAISDNVENACVIFEKKITFPICNTHNCTEKKFSDRRFVSVTFSPAANAFITASVTNGSMKDGYKNFFIEARYIKDPDTPVIIEGGTLGCGSAAPALFFSKGGRYMGIFKAGTASVIDLTNMKRVFMVASDRTRAALCPYFTDDMKICFITAMSKAAGADKIGGWKEAAVELFDPDSQEIVSRSIVSPQRFERFAALYRPDKCAYLGALDAMLCPAENGSIIMFDMATLEPVDEFRGHCDQPAAVRTVFAGANLISCAADCTLRIWKVMRVKKVEKGALDKWRTKFSRPYNLYFMLSGAGIVAVLEDGIRKTHIDPKTGAFRETFVKCSGRDYFEKQTFSPEGNIIVPDRGRQFKLLEKNNYGGVTLLENKNAAMQFKFSDDGRYFAAAACRDVLTVDLAMAFDDAVSPNLIRPRNRATAIAYADLYSLKLAGSRFAFEFMENGMLALIKDRSTIVLDIESMKVINEVKYKMEGFHESIAGGGSPDGEAYSISGGRIAVKTGPDVIEIYDCVHGREQPCAINRFGGEDAVSQFRLCGGGNYLLVKNGGRRCALSFLQLFRAGSNESLYQYESQNGISDFAVNRDMSMIALYDGTGRLIVLKLVFNSTCDVPIQSC